MKTRKNVFYNIIRQTIVTVFLSLYVFILKTEKNIDNLI